MSQSLVTVLYIQDIQIALGKAIVYTNNDEPNNFDSRYRYKLREIDSHKVLFNFQMFYKIKLNR